MKKIAIAGSAFTLLLLGAKAFAANPVYRPGEVIVKYKDRSSVAAAARASLQRLGAVKIQNLGSSSTFVHAMLIGGESVEDAVAELQSDPTVEYAQPNYIYHVTSMIPNDPNFSSLWGLKNTGQTISPLSAANGVDSTHNPPGGSTAGKDMGLTDAWDKITDCSSVTVAVIDTGIKYDHDDLSANMWDPSHAIVPHSGHNSITGAVDANDPMDDHGHGTHVAGTIGAVGNNGIGTTGVCWKARLMAIKALDSQGSGSTADIVSGLNWAVSHGAKVINMSLGGSSADPAFQSAISSALQQGVVVVVAAGNDGSNNDLSATYPCNYRLANMVCVAALDQAYSMANFSNYGSSSVDVGAPGVNIASTWPFAVTALSDNFSSNWTYSPSSSGWGMQSALNIGAGALNSLTVPSNWDGHVQYANNADYRAYKTFDLSGGYTSVTANFWTYWDTENNRDFINVYSNGAGGDPTGGALISQITGASGNYIFSESAEVAKSCLTSTCSIGFQFTSDGANTATGAVLMSFELKKNSYATNAYNVIAGTSMATPHVAGLAAMLFAYNPNYTYADVVAAIKGGGAYSSALSGRTTTGKSVNAMGSLAYIRAPSGVTAVRQ